MTTNFELILSNLCELSKQTLSVDDIINCLTTMIIKLRKDDKDKVIDDDTITCVGCTENQPNQLAHMDIGGCMYNDYNV